MSAFFRIAVSSLGAAAAVVVAGCASSGKPVAATAEKPVTVTVEAPMAEKDALGNYRFLMQQAGKNMSADQFDAWMKANAEHIEYEAYFNEPMDYIQNDLITQNPLGRASYQNWVMNQLKQ